MAFSNALASVSDLLAMTTINAASALGLSDRLGKIAVGYYADLAVYAGDVSKPYDAIARLILVHAGPSAKAPTSGVLRCWLTSDGMSR